MFLHHLIIVTKALSTLRTSIVSIPGREPFKTILVQPKSQDAPRTVLPLITFPHGGPHGTTSTRFSPTTAALALEGNGSGFNYPSHLLEQLLTEYPQRQHYL